MYRLYILPLFICVFTITKAQHKTQHKQPNIVFILADDLGFGDLGVYGQSKIETPNIDKLAHSGIRFTNFYAGTSVCAPSRSSLLTGQHTGHTYIRGNKEIQPEGQEPLADSVLTFAMLLQQAGYVTGAFGKWGLGMVGTSGAPNRKGFDVFYGYNCQRQSHRYYPTHLWDNESKIMLEGNDLIQQNLYAPDLIQEKTLAFIEDNKDKPFFLFVPTVLPHAELSGPMDSLYQKYAHRFEENPYSGNDYGPQAKTAGYTSVQKPRAMFASMVNRIDVYVGQIIDQLSKLGLLDNTLILFASDNGAHKEGGADPSFFDSTAGLRGYKRDLYEGGIRVPFIASWHTVIQPDQVTAHVGAFWDIMPTLTELAQTSLRSGHTDGISFLPTLLNKGKQSTHDYLYWEFQEKGGQQAMLQDGWKLIILEAKDLQKRLVSLYYLPDDPYEKNNVAEQNPERVKKMLDKIEQAHVESPIFNFYK